MSARSPIAGALALLLLLTLLPMIVIVVILTAGGGDIAAAPPCTSVVTTTLDGVPPTAKVTGTVRVAQANIPGRSTNYTGAVRRALTGRPDLVTLNEQSSRADREILKAAPGYSMWRDKSRDTATKDQRQALDPVVLWRSDVFTKQAAGRTRLVLNDRTIYDGHPVVWSRYAEWATMKRTSDGATMSIVSVHMPTNPDRYGPNKPLRRSLYGQGMDALTGLIRELNSYGPVIVAGDFNVHPSIGTGAMSQGDDAWAAPMKMRAVGYGYVDADVDYIFYASTAGVRASTTAVIRQPARWSDHPVVQTTLSFNGVGADPDQAAGQGTVDLGGSAGSIGTAATPGSVGLSNTAFAAARTVITTMAPLGEQAQIDAITAALAESNLNPTAADPTSSALGLYQVLVGTAGADAGKRTDPAWQARWFLRQLQALKGWQSMTPGEVALAIERSGETVAYYQAKAEQAQAIVTALAGGAGAAFGQVCSTTSGTDVAIGVGTGQFVPSTYPAIPDMVAVMARAQQRAGTSGWASLCERLANTTVFGLPNAPGHAYPSAHSQWVAAIAKGWAHAGDRSPPPGALLYYLNSNQYGHVALYLGNNKILTNDYPVTGQAAIVDAAAMETTGWHLPYLGWSYPFLPSGGADAPQPTS